MTQLSNAGRTGASPVIECLSIAFQTLPPVFDGLRVAVLADVHAGLRRRGVAAVDRIIAEVNSLDADLILLLGDLIHWPRDGGRFVPSLTALRAGLGVYGTLGNHEHGHVWYTGFRPPWPGPTTSEWMDTYREAGVRILVNESAPITRENARIWLVGVDDAYSRRDDLQAALRGTEPEEFKLGLTHSPDLVDDPLAERLDLLLAGHTHGGQVNFPLTGPLFGPYRKPSQRAAGLVKVGGAHMYVSRGAGEGLPLRYRCPREITLLTLQTAG